MLVRLLIMDILFFGVSLWGVVQAIKRKSLKKAILSVGIFIGLNLIGYFGLLYFITSM